MRINLPLKVEIGRVLRDDRYPNRRIPVPGPPPWTGLKSTGPLLKRLDVRSKVFASPQSDSLNDFLNPKLGTNRGASPPSAHAIAFRDVGISYTADYASAAPSDAKLRYIRNVFDMPRISIASSCY